MSTATMTKLTGDKFPLGRTVMTRGVQAAMFNGGLNPVDYLRRHASGDWGDVSDNDKRANDAGLKPGDEADRLVSAYQVNSDLRILIITEWDRSVTTILLPSEY